MFSEKRRQMLLDMPRYPGFSHIKRFWMPKHKKFGVKIVAGDFYISNQDEIIATVLGSCISVCIRDVHKKIGGINHFILPDSDRQVLSSSNRYGVFAMERLINSIIKAGGNRRDFEIKVVGGGNMIGGVNDVGGRNIQFIRDFLAVEGFSTTAEDLGGFHGRKIQYNVTTGQLMVRKLENAHQSILAALDAETRHKASLLDDNTGEVELFD
ncbi:MAG: hypothetical protein HRU25_00135 [Psychrobium sp.]|nr:hypothetical protein [Psychrobium sp.]